MEVDSLVAQLEVLQKETVAEEEAAEAAAAAAAPLERHAAAASDKAEDLEDTAEVSGNHILGAAARKLLDKLRNLQQLEARASPFDPRNALRRGPALSQSVPPLG